eukprot:1157097-Pelagomonas_calceolata.AAC.8
MAWNSSPTDKMVQKVYLNKRPAVVNSPRSNTAFAHTCAACGPASFCAQIAAMMLGRPAAARAPSCSELADESWWLAEALPFRLLADECWWLDEALPFRLWLMSAGGWMRPCPWGLHLEPA